MEIINYMKNNILYRCSNWEEIENLCENIYFQIKVSNFVPKTIVGLSRGGLVPAVILAHKLRIRNVQSIQVISYEDGSTKRSENTEIKGTIKDRENLLIVDDIIDTGESLKALINQLQLEKENYKIAVLFFNKEKACINPDFYGEKINSKIWVVFPWEQVSSQRLGN